MARSSVKKCWAGLRLGSVLVLALVSTARADEPGDRASAPPPGDPCSTGRAYEALAAQGDARDHQLALLHFRRCLREGRPGAGRADIEARIARLMANRPAPTALVPRAPAPAGSTVPIRITAYGPDGSYEVSIRSDAASSAPPSCTTPCTIDAAQGDVHLHAEGAGAVDADILVPPTPGEIRLQHPDRALRIAGGILIPTGILMGGSMWLLSQACPIGQNAGACQATQMIVWPVLGAGVLATGIALLVRSRKVPDDANRVLLAGRGSWIRACHLRRQSAARRRRSGPRAHVLTDMRTSSSGSAFDMNLSSPRRLAVRVRWAGALVLGVGLGCAPSTVVRADEAPKAAAAAPAAPWTPDMGRPAIRQMEDVYAAAPDPGLAREIAARYEALAAAGDPRDARLAIFYYEEALRSERSAPARADVEERLRRLRGRLVAGASPGPTQPWGSSRPAWKTHSPGLAAGGVVLLVLGAASIIAGAVVGPMCGSGGTCGGWLAGVPLIIHGAGCFAGGIPMVVIGMRKVPAAAPTITPLWVKPTAGVPRSAAVAPVGLAATWLF